MKKIKITYDAFDKMEEKIMKKGYDPGEWYPTLEDLNTYVIPDPGKYGKFLLFLSHMTDLTPEQQEVRKEINRILYKLYEFQETKKRKGDLSAIPPKGSESPQLN